MFSAAAKFHVFGKVIRSTHSEAAFPRGKEKFPICVKSPQRQSCRITLAVLLHSIDDVKSNFSRGINLNRILRPPTRLTALDSILVIEERLNHDLSVYSTTSKGAQREPIGILYHQLPYRSLHTFTIQAYLAGKKTFSWQTSIRRSSGSAKKVEIFIFDGTLQTIYSRRGFLFPSAAPLPALMINETFTDLSFSKLN